MASKFLNANTDVNLGTANDQVPSQNAVKTYVDNKKLEDLPDVTITSPSNDQVLKYDSNSQKWVNGTGGGGSVEIDNLTITENLSNEIQTVATLNQNDITKGLKTWSGTLTEYETITTKDSDTLYYVQEVPQQISLYQPPLLSSMWSDHLINDLNWLRADTFSWQSGSTYSLVYNELVSEYNSASSVTETEGSITFKRTPKGYKIALADEESDISTKYSTDGIAWYYILDTTNTQFKLPRTKFGFEGLRNNVGNDISESLPNISGNFGMVGLANYWTQSDSNPFYASALENDGAFSGSSSLKKTWVNYDASRSSSVYQNNAPVQERATQMYLYFYVGQFAQSAIQQTAGLNSSLFNSKVDLNASNLSNTGKTLISSLGMPGARYVDLTMGSRGTTYTAPANGWFVFGKRASAAGQFFNVEYLSPAEIPLWSDVGSGASTNILGHLIPVQKGQIVKIDYNTGGDTTACRFVYAEGDQD